MKKMLVALDGSPRERGVLAVAVAIAEGMGARVVLFRSVAVQAIVPEEAYAMSPSDVPALLEDRAKAELAALAATVPPSALAGVRVDIGPPWPAIERAAAEEDVDLIVIGSHGYDALDRVLGTTASRVVNHADRAVLVVRAPERFL